MPFTTLGFDPSLLPSFLKAIRQQGYEAPTAIQTASVPAALQGQDVLARGQTGSGKTAAFVWPLLHRAMLHMPNDATGAGQRGPRVLRSLVLVPTRELAVQVGQVLLDVAQHLPHRRQCGGGQGRPQRGNSRRHPRRHPPAARLRRGAHRGVMRGRGRLPCELRRR